jgi:transposase InsO family protein
MIRFVDAHRDRFGVEPIIGVLRGADAGFVSVSGYYAAKARPPSARAVRDAALRERIVLLHKENYGVYGVRKMHAALRRDGVDVGRDQVARLMRDLGLQGVRRGRCKRTTVPDSTVVRPADLVNRQFTAERPNALWVCDLTYIRTWAGFAYLALVIDVYSRRLVGWALTTHLRTSLPLEALEMAIWARTQRLDGLIHHSDAGSQGGFNWSSQHLRMEVGEWDGRGVGLPLGRGGRRCGRRVAHRFGDVNMCSGSGRRSLAESRARMPALKRACLPLSPRVGSARTAACRRTASLRCQAGT